jgi:hypothetical protein
MARSGRIPSVGARLDTTARVADDPEAPPVVVELTVTEVDGRRISAIALHRNQPTRSSGTPGTGAAE